MNTFTLSSKSIPDLARFHTLTKSTVSAFQGFLLDGNIVTVLLDCEVNQTLIDAIEAIVPPSPTTLELYKTVVSGARTFGTSIIIEFAAENIILGITQDNMTGVVRGYLGEVVNCLMTGSLYDAINEAKALPEEAFDPKYITEQRILHFVNKIETYLHITLSTSL